MITILLFGYLALVLVAFKVIKIRVSPVSVATVVVIGIFLMGGILAGWKFTAPMTKQMVLRRHVLPIVPGLRETVSQVHVTEGQMVQEGDPIFDVLPDRYQDAVDKATAQQAAAEASVSQLEASLAAAEAAIQKAEADTAAAKAKFDMAAKAQQLNPGSIAELSVETAKQGFRVAEAGEKTAAATRDQAKAALEVAQHSVEVAKAAKQVAEFDLGLCTYRAHCDGQVMNMQINEGTNAAAWRFTSMGTVMDMSDTAILAVYPQNVLKHVEAGNPVEIAFKRRPGEVVTGTVDAVIKYTGEGQLLPSRALPSVATLGSKGYLVVRIRIDDEELARELPLGAAGSLAIYTDVGKPFHLISKISVRLNAWMNYAPF